MPVIGDVVPEEITTVTAGHQKHIAGHHRLLSVISGVPAVACDFPDPDKDLEWRAGETVT